MNTLAESATVIESDRLALEAMLHEAAAPTFATLVLHPHPQFGGDMRNHVVTCVCAALAAEGATTLRFNFRGVGASQGAHDDGRGEARDTVAAARWLRQRRPGAPLVIAGYSFGALIAAVAATETGAAALVLVSPPLGRGGLVGQPAVLPTLIVAGDGDQYAAASELQALAGESLRTVIVPGVDHFWLGGLDALEGVVRSFVRDDLRDVVAASAHPPATLVG